MKNSFKIVKLALIIIFISVFIQSCNLFKKKEKEVAIAEPKFEYGINVDSLIVIKNTIKSGDYLGVLLSEYVTQSKVDELVKNTSDIFNPRDIKIGNNYCFLLAPDSTIEYFIYEKDIIEYVVWNFDDSISAKKYQRPVEKVVKVVGGKISGSLWNTLVECGSHHSLASELSEIYAWKIDFFGIQNTDEFRVLHEEIILDSVCIDIGKIYACSFKHKGKVYYAYPFQKDSLSKVEYFNEKGENLRTAFLKAPLKYSRVSSKFSNSRLHPVLRIRRPHHGVDYAAPSGTPVQSIGAGEVISAKYSRGGGNTIKIKHNKTYSTSYLHLRNFAKGIRAGKRVSQGEVIGYVGSTGLSTGPHLDFRLYKNGKAIDPLKAESPPADPVPQNQMSSFTQMVDSLKTKIEIK